MEFPQAAKTGWLVGSVQEVAWVSQAGHQGGYTYRLCHLGSKGPAGLEENCFRNNILPFASNTTMVRLVGRENLGSWQEWPQVTLTPEIWSCSDGRPTSLWGLTLPAAPGGRPASTGRERYTSGRTR